MTKQVRIENADTAGYTVSTIKIVRTWDGYECDTCGYSESYGADIFIDDILAIELKPISHCTEPVDFSDEDIMKKILEFLGHTVTIEDSGFQ